jgi:uncharacterized membrane protein YfcA
VNPGILALIFVGGFLAGVINTLAGGGSIITLPLLIFAGLPANAANATNRVAIVFQNVAALSNFRRYGLTVGREAWLLLIPSVLGGVLGARIAITIDETTLRRVIGCVLVLMLIPILRRKSPRPPGAGRAGSAWWQWPVYFGIGVYGGFIQVGVGFMYLALLAGLQGYDLIRANLLKVFYVLVYSVLALALFAWAGQVHWLSGLALAVGTAAGGWLGAKIAVERGERWIRAVLVVAIGVAAVELTGVGGWLLRAFHLR